MDFGLRTPEEALKQGYDALIELRNAHVLKRDASLKDHAKAEVELIRTKEQLLRNEDRVKIADDMIASFLGGFTTPVDTPNLVGLGRFARWKLKVALETIFQEDRSRWFTVPELEKKLKDEGFDGEFAQMNSAIDAACRRFKRDLETRKGAEGRQYRLADLLTRMDAALNDDAVLSISHEEPEQPGPGEEE